MDLESNAPLTDERRENWMRCEEEDELNNFSLPFLLSGPTIIYVTRLCGRTRAKPNPPGASRNELLRAVSTGLVGWNQPMYRAIYGVNHEKRD